jgi:uncharacterized protein (DUF1697 family)
MCKYVAFLRGINVGGHKPVKMEEVKESFGALGFKNVKTVLASGNVCFEAPPAGADVLAKRIEEKLQQTFGHEIGVLIRKIEELQRLADTNPFKGVRVTPQTRLYITLISETSKSDPKIPRESPDKNFKIMRITSGEVCSVLTLSPRSRTTDLMKVLERAFGRKVTTRNWNTIARILRACH